jgi:hypothetical protein
MAEPGLWAGIDQPVREQPGLWDALMNAQFSPGTAWGNKAADIGSKLAYGAMKGLITLPQRAIDASVQDVQHLGDPEYERQAIGPAAETALMMTGGAGIVPAEANALRAGLAGRKLPTDNYTGPVSRYTDALYREMHPSEALIDLPTSVAHGGYGPGGVQKRFYADQPDLALGQGSNRGVRVEYDAAPFEGQINQQKPAWDLAFQNGNAEYVAAPRSGANIRDSVRSFEVDPSTLSRVERAQYQRLIANLEGLGWDVKRTSDRIVVTRPK